MSYTVYTTEGFILSTSPHGEANRLYCIFTREFGVIYATAQGVRLAKSKLRGHLTEFSRASVSLVKGKEFWRLTSAQVIETNRDPLYVQILSILKRLLQGEGEHTTLFDFLKEKLCSDIDETEVMLEILIQLGYVDKEEIQDADSKKRILLINQGLKASQL